MRAMDSSLAISHEAVVGLLAVALFIWETLCSLRALLPGCAKCAGFLAPWHRVTEMGVCKHPVHKECRHVQKRCIYCERREAAWKEDDMRRRRTAHLRIAQKALLKTLLKVC